jgi:hypothetical protein
VTAAAEAAPVAWLRTDDAADVLEVPRGSLSNGHHRFRNSDCCIRLPRPGTGRNWCSYSYFHVWREDVIELAAELRRDARLGRHGISIHKAIEAACEALHLDHLPKPRSDGYRTAVSFAHKTAIGRIERVANEAGKCQPARD